MDGFPGGHGWDLASVGLEVNLMTDSVYHQQNLKGGQLNMAALFWYLVNVTFQVYATVQ